MGEKRTRSKFTAEQKKEIVLLLSAKSRQCLLRAKDRSHANEIER